MPENGIVSSIGNLAADFNSQDFPVIFPTEAINVRTYRDADESLADYKTFDFDYINKTNPLLEKELFGQLEKVLQAHGMTRAEKNPQITISMDFFIGKKEQYTPPQTVTSTELQYVWNFGQFGGNWGGFSSAVPITRSGTIPGYTTTTYYSNIRLNFLNHAKLAEGAKLETPPFIWLGEADSEGLESDIRGIAPVMFGELIGEFPDQSAKAPRRHVRRFRYGGLGLGFDPADWRVVRHVEPFSVAAEHGIKPGDILMKVNGDRALINWVGRGAQYLNNPGRYRSKDPYFQYVLSNHGDSDIELVIESAETGKKVTLKMRPRSESSYLHVNINPLQKIAKANPVGIIFVIIVSVIIIYYLFLK
ncbi:MAG: hypothetical protein Q7J30_00130 [Candidatus Azambacteria bacterium]|nr:hypothetical protein [Candidatus Azambacteria bacterium]